MRQSSIRKAEHMFVWRARIGYLCPSVFEMIAYDFYRVVPPGVGMIGVTCMIDGWQADAYRTGLARIEECAIELSRRKCDFIIHAGVPLVVSQGNGYEREVINKIETLTKTPATTSIVAGIEALKALSVRRIGLVNPYPSELNAAVVAFMKGHGFEVDAVVSLGADFTRIGDVSESDVYAAAKQAVNQSPKLEGLYLPCPQFPALDVIEAIECDFGIPAVGHLTSEIWMALKRLNIRHSVPGFGKLLTMM
jgi:maleate isomerase